MQHHREAKHNPRILINYGLSMPFVYSVFIPAVFLDICVEIYHRICFKLYGLPYVKRLNYIRIDRQKLSYLSWLEKINCAYCGYINGLFHYVSVIAAETEKYWCGIMHAKYKGFKAPAHHKNFLPYGDEQAYNEFVNEKGEEKEPK